MILLVVARDQREAARDPVLLGLLDPVARRGDEIPHHVARGGEGAAAEQHDARARRARSRRAADRARGHRGRTVRAAGRRGSPRLRPASPRARRPRRRSARSPRRRARCRRRSSANGRWWRRSCPTMSPSAPALDTPSPSTSGKLGRPAHARTPVRSLPAVGQREPGLHPVEARPFGARIGGERSLWTIPLPAVIRLIAPGSITLRLPIESRCSIAPSNK